MNNPFIRNLKPAAWEWPVSAAALLLGGMMTWAVISNEGRPSNNPEIDRRIVEGTINIAEFEKQAKVIEQLRAETTRLENTLAGSGKVTQVLNKSLQDTKLFAGLTVVVGPGVTVSLFDSQKIELSEDDRIVHDFDVLRVVNELWASGAEAIEVNGHRVAGSSCIRCVGPVIHVDHKPIASPINIRAVGDPDVLMGAMLTPGGVIEEIRRFDPAMVRVDRVKEHRFRAFEGTTQPKFAKVPKDSK